MYSHQPVVQSVYTTLHSGSGAVATTDTTRWLISVDISVDIIVRHHSDSFVPRRIAASHPTPREGHGS